MNKKYTYVWISFIVLVFGIITVPSIVDRITSGTIVKHDRINAVDNNEALAYVMINGEKAKAPNFEFINQDSVLISKQDYANKVYVVDFFFTSCPGICKPMTANLVRLQNDFADRDDFGIASFSIAPDHDTPKILKDYALANGATAKNWNFLTGKREDIHQIANIGFNIFASIMPDAPGGFEHSGLFALVDKEGYIRSRKDEFGNPIVYYRGAITLEMVENNAGEQEQIGILKKDIIKLLEE